MKKYTKDFPNIFYAALWIELRCSCETNEDDDRSIKGWVVLKKELPSLLPTFESYDLQLINVRGKDCNFLGSNIKSFLKAFIQTGICIMSANCTSAISEGTWSKCCSFVEGKIKIKKIVTVAIELLVFGACLMHEVFMWTIIEWNWITQCIWIGWSTSERPSVCK